MAKNTDTITAFLREMHMFQGISREDLDDIAREFKLRTYKARQYIFYEGDPGLMMYLIEDGQVRIYVNTLDGSETSVVMLGAGQLFGELALIDEDTRSANAVAIAKTSCYTLHRNTFHMLIERYPQIARNTMRLLSQRIRASTRHVESLVSLDVMQRVARTLADLAEEHGTKNEDGKVQINFVLRDAHIASMVGASRESVNRTFRSLRDLGLIERNAGSLIIIDSDRLDDLIN